MESRKRLFFFSEYMFIELYQVIKRKGRDLTQSYDKNTYTHRKIQKATRQHKKRHQKLRLLNDCGPT